MKKHHPDWMVLFLWYCSLRITPQAAFFPAVWQKENRAPVQMPCFMWINYVILEICDVFEGFEGFARGLRYLPFACGYQKTPRFKAVSMA